MSTHATPASHRFSSVAALMVGVAVCLASCVAQEQPLEPLVAIGDPFDPTFSVCAAGHAARPDILFRDCSFDFGDIEITANRLF